MSKHTPGPWRVSKCPDIKGYSIYADGGMRSLANVKPLEHGEGNARLIAAAPEMLHFLKLFYDSSEDNEESGNPTMQKLGDLLAKVEGK